MTGSAAPGAPGSTGRPTASPTRTSRSATGPTTTPNCSCCGSKPTGTWRYLPTRSAIRAKSRAELEGTVRVYTRAAQTAPPDMSRQLDYYRKQAAGLERQAEQAEADGDAQLASDSRAAAAEETRQADELSAAQDVRDAWDRAHEAKRLAARAARQELDRRGIEPEPERREPESLIGWWRQFEADAAGSRAGTRTTAPGSDRRRPALAAQARRDRQDAGSRGAQRHRTAAAGRVPSRTRPGTERASRQRMPEPAQPEPEPEREAEPGTEADVSERIDASIRRVAGGRPAGSR